MAGIYVHIPFCKQACYYCNFHFSTQLDNRDQMVAAICKDIQLRHNYLEERKLDSLYFGGGTPSLLSIGQLAQIMDALKRYFTIGHNAEITLECNPDDIDSSYLEGLKELGVNRLSLGVQSFFDTDLVFMHRAHNAKHALKSLDLIRHAGFQNVTLDLIYAAPTTTDEMWLHNLQKVVEAGVPHLSAYCLTIEENTVFGRWHKHQKMQAIDEERASSQFYVMVDMLAHAGYEQYEISNFAKPGYEAVHNGNYWKGKPYLGIGPAAHSYNGIERSWNVANNAKYLKAMANDDPAIETEVLSSADQCNEMIMTRLRTSWGLDMQTLEEKFGARLAEEVYAGLRDPWLADHVDIEGAVVRLNRRGKIMADRIAAYLFVTSQL
jgi:oxygen-independent coproporphyrinogen-3 oxidase